MPSSASLREWEKALRALGGRPEGGKRPDQLAVWRPANAGGWDWFDARSWDYCETPCTCLKRTTRGDRAFVYETGSDAAITAILDFQAAPGDRLPHWGYAAPAVFRPLPIPVPR